MNYIYLVVTSTGYLRKTNQYGESIDPYYDWDEETNIKKTIPMANIPIPSAGSMNLNSPMELSNIGKSYNNGSIIEP